MFSDVISISSWSPEFSVGVFADDQRVNVVVLTGAGRDEYGSALSDLHEVESTLCEGLSDEDLEAFFRITGVIRGNIGRRTRQM